MCRVIADIVYLDGALAGLPLVRGWACYYPTAQARKVAEGLERTRQQGDFVRAVVTGNRYKVCGHIVIEQHGV